MADAVSRIGRATRFRIARQAETIAFLGAALRETARIPPRARPLVARATAQQLHFTAVQGLPVVCLVALLIGGLVVLQLYARAVALGVAQTTVDILVTVVVRELGPVLAAIIVTGRSGTAVATELGAARLLGEVRGLEALGISPLLFYVLPRIVGLAISVVLLTIVFDTVALSSGLVFAAYGGGVPMVEYLAGLRDALSLADVYLTLGKSGLIGVGVALCCASEALMHTRRTTDLPGVVSRAVVRSFLFIFAASALMSFLAYRWL